MNFEDFIKFESIILNKFQSNDTFLINVLNEEYKFLSKNSKGFSGVTLLLSNSTKNDFEEFHTAYTRKSVNTIHTKGVRVSLTMAELKSLGLYDALIKQKKYIKFKGIPYSQTTKKSISGSVVNKAHAVYIFPIVHYNNVVGLLIFYSANSKLPKTTKALLEYLVQITNISLQRIRYETETYNLKKQVEYLKKHKEDADKRKDDFISVVSHELKTPISIAKNNLWMFKNKYGTQITNEELHYLKSLEHGLYRMQKIVDNMLDLSRIQDNRLELEVADYDLYDLTLQSVRSFREQADKKGLELIYPKKLVAPIETDGARLQEVIENLISNAIKYTEKGSVAVLIDDHGDSYVISVVDTGPGISDHDKVKIFTKFGQASEGLKLSKSGESTGLGLYVAKNFIRQMGGEIGFDSEIEKGSIFWIKIPKTYEGERKSEKAKKNKSFFVFNTEI